MIKCRHVLHSKAAQASKPSSVLCSIFSSVLSSFTIVPNQCMFFLVSALLYEFWFYIPSVLEFLDPPWLLTIFPLKCLVLYSIFFLFLFCLMLVVSWFCCSPFVTGYGCRSSDRVGWATIGKTWEGIVAVCPFTIFLPPFFLHSCITILNKFPKASMPCSRVQ